MKKYLLILAIGLPVFGFAQTYYINKITVKVLDESITIDKAYEVKREGKWVYFYRAMFNGNDGWAFQIIDSTKNKTYVLDYH